MCRRCDGRTTAHSNISAMLRGAKALSACGLSATHDRRHGATTVCIFWSAHSPASAPTCSPKWKNDEVTAAAISALAAAACAPRAPQPSGTCTHGGNGRVPNDALVAGLSGSGASFPLAHLPDAGVNTAVLQCRQRRRGVGGSYFGRRRHAWKMPRSKKGLTLRSKVRQGLTCLLWARAPRECKGTRNRQQDLRADLATNGGIGMRHMARETNAALRWNTRAFAGAEIRDVGDCKEQLGTPDRAMYDAGAGDGMAWALAEGRGHDAGAAVQLEQVLQMIMILFDTTRRLGLRWLWRRQYNLRHERGSCTGLRNDGRVGGGKCTGSSNKAEGSMNGAGQLRNRLQRRAAATEHERKSESKHETDADSTGTFRSARFWGNVAACGGQRRAPGGRCSGKRARLREGESCTQGATFLNRTGHGGASAPLPPVNGSRHIIPMHSVAKGKCQSAGRNSQAMTFPKTYRFLGEHPSNQCTDGVVQCIGGRPCMPHKPEEEGGWPWSEATASMQRLVSEMWHGGYSACIPAVCDHVDRLTRARYIEEVTAQRLCTSLYARRVGAVGGCVAAASVACGAPDSARPGQHTQVWRECRQRAMYNRQRSAGSGRRAANSKSRRLHWQAASVPMKIGQKARRDKNAHLRAQLELAPLPLLSPLHLPAIHPGLLLARRDKATDRKLWDQWRAKKNNVMSPDRGDVQWARV
ncbi:hypothetical protein GGX14DRAFT_593544 [Mycena pura]|uniref:Uncharacterized protein n=1 Tax=Mycena pura TaxID=153505 RepID=A0AAD6URD7_9AGAR|nr:hypothetical protein GGX14DRAFT_593544 [Mycena pura]